MDEKLNYLHLAKKGTFTGLIRVNFRLLPVLPVKKRCAILKDLKRCFKIKGHYQDFESKISFS